MAAATLAGADIESFLRQNEAEELLRKMLGDDDGSKDKE